MVLIWSNEVCQDLMCFSVEVELNVLVKPNGSEVV